MRYITVFFFIVSSKFIVYFIAHLNYDSAHFEGSVSTYVVTVLVSVVPRPDDIIK